MSQFSESVVEQAALAWLESIGWQVRNGAAIAPGEPAAERNDYGQVVLVQRLRDALARLNPALPAEALDDAFRKLTRPEGAELVARSRALHRLLVDGVTVEYRTAEGEIRGAQARVIDFDQPSANDWLAVNQFSVTENKHARRPDVVLFVNGLALAVVELKNAADESATIWSAWQQLQTYKAEIASLFATNALLAISDGVEARVGTLTAGREWFKPWRTIAGEGLADLHLPELQVVIEGLCSPQRFLDLVRDFIVYEDDGSGRIAKKMAGYHRNCVPLVPLKAAAGAFGDPQHVLDDDFEWVAVETRRRLRPGMFAARVEGRSMEPAIPDGALCLFSAPVEGTRQGKTVLVRLRDAIDPETGERYTVKRYESEKAPAGGSWRHVGITLKPLNPAYEPIVLSPDEGDRLQVVAELVEVIGASPREDARFGDRRIGVVWHTQGSGKSLTMAFYAGRIIREPAMENPTIVMLTDRNDLDDQLFGTFSRCKDLLRAAARLVYRLHRHADRAGRRQHARGVWRLHQRVRHPACRAGWRHGAHLLRKPAGQAGTRRGRAAEDRPGIRGGHRGQGGRAQGEAQDQVGATRGRRRRGETARDRGARHCRALRDALRSAGRQGDGRVHEPAHLRGAACRDREASAAVGERRR